MAYNLVTKHGHNFYDIASMLQKAIRRGDIDRAGYAANELFYQYQTYLWKRLYVISCEDCYGIMTQEIVALKMAHDFVNKGKPTTQQDLIFVSKAITLLCMARKNRDACYVACNFMFPNRTLEVEEIPYAEIDKCGLPDDKIPDWVYDVHTAKGKAMGKTTMDMTITEGRALEPHQMSLFDDASWGPNIRYWLDKGAIKNERNKRLMISYMMDREDDPTHNGETWPEVKDNFGPIKDPVTVEVHK